MAENTTQEYFDYDDEGHNDIRNAKFKRENLDKHLGYNLGIDAMG